MAKLEKGFIIRAAGLLMAVQILSRVLGYARDVVMLNIFGQGFETDAWNAAFSIPDFIYAILIGGAIGAALIPVFSSYINTDRTLEGWKVSSIFTSWLMLVLVICLVFACIFTEPLLNLLTQFTHEQMALPIALTRITLVQAFFMALSAIATGLLQSYQHFFWPAMGTLFYNVVILLCGIFLVRPIEAIWPGYGIAAFSIGVVVGAFVTLAVQMPMLKKVGFHFQLRFDVHNEGMRKLLRLIIPVMIGLSVTKINLLVTQKLATGLDSGMYTALLTGNRFMQLPLGVFAFSVATALFPTMSAQAAKGEISEMKSSISMGVRNIIFVLLPSSVGLVLLREPIIRMLYEFSGEFTAFDTMIAGQALLYYSLGLLFYGAVTVFIRGFYAMQDTLTPIVVSVLCIGVNILFSLLLVDIMGHRGLALAYSLAGAFQCITIMLVLRKKIGQMNLKKMLYTLLKTMAASLVMGLGVWLTAQGCDAWFGVATKGTQMIQVLVSIGVGMILFFGAALLMKMEEMRAVIHMLTRRFRRRQAKA